MLRAGAWAARGLRVPSRNALLADTVSTSAYGRAYGFERMMDNLGAVGGPPQSPPVASLLPLAVRAGALAFAGLVAGSRERTRRRCTRTTRARVGPPRPALPTAMRHDTGLAQPWASRRVERGRGDAQGVGAERRPSWASHWRFVLAARHGRRAVLRLLGNEHSPCVRERTRVKRLPGRQPRVRTNGRVLLAVARRVPTAVAGEVLDAACGAIGGIRHIDPFKVQEDFMSTHASPRIGAEDYDTRGAVAPRAHVRRLSTRRRPRSRRRSSSPTSPSSSASSSPARSLTRPTLAASAPARSGSTPRSSPSATWCRAGWRSPAAATRTTPTTATGSDSWPSGRGAIGRLAVAGFASSDADPAAS